MYKNGEAALERILELVAKCPKELQEKCFEVLINGYVQLEIGGQGGKPQPPASPTQPIQPQAPPAESQIPAAVRPRFKTTAKRLGVTAEKIEALFDFGVDPFALHPVSLPGKNVAEKTRNVALLAASRSYLATGSWSADWQEVKALCVNYNCYDPANHAVNLKKAANGKDAIFKAAEPRKSIELSSHGVQEAEKLLKQLAKGSAE